MSIGILARDRELPLILHKRHFFSIAGPAPAVRARKPHRQHESGTITRHSTVWALAGCTVRATMAAAATLRKEGFIAPPCFCWGLGLSNFSSCAVRSLAPTGNSEDCGQQQQCRGRLWNDIHVPGYIHPESGHRPRRAAV